MHTMKPGRIIVTVTCTTAAGTVHSASHPAMSGEWFLNSLLLAALPPANEIAFNPRRDDDPYQMRPTCDRLVELWEDEHTRAGDVEHQRYMDDGLRRIIDSDQRDG